MTETLILHATALDEFDRRVRAIRDDQWHAPTPDTDWDVRDLVAHLVVEQLWVPPLLGGATTAEIGDRFDGDQLGGDPVAAWADASAAARAAFTAPGALDRTVELSYGSRTADGYCREMTMDLTVHAWDLARAIGAEETLDETLVREVYGMVEGQGVALASSGLFDDPVDVADDADPQTQLLALLGRRA